MVVASQQLPLETTEVCRSTAFAVSIHLQLKDLSWARSIFWAISKKHVSVEGNVLLSHPTGSIMLLLSQMKYCFGFLVPALLYLYHSTGIRGEGEYVYMHNGTGF